MGPYLQIISVKKFCKKYRKTANLQQKRQFKSKIKNYFTVYF